MVSERSEESTAENVDSEIPLGISTIGALKTSLPNGLPLLPLGRAPGALQTEFFSFAHSGVARQKTGSF